MKKFMVIIISLIVTISLGFTVYAFVKNNEQIKLVQSNYYLNSGEEFEVDFSFINKKKQTKITFDLEEAQGIERTEATDAYKFKTIAGGTYVVKAKTTNKNFPEFTISITVGDGSEKYPYYIKTKEDFLNLGTGNTTLDKNFVLTTDIDLTGENFTGFGSFSGKFNGNGYCISNATYNPVVTTSAIKTMSSTTIVSNIALFSQITTTGKFENVKLENFNFTGSFSNASIVTNINHGIIKNVNIVSCKITNNSTASEARTAGVAAINESINNVQARIDRVAANVELEGNAIVAGLTAKNSGAIVINSYSTGKLNGKLSNSKVAGLVVLNSGAENKLSYVKDCYSICKIEGEVINKASLILNNDYDKNIIRGCYYCDELTECSVAITDYTSTNFNANSIAQVDMSNMNKYISYVKEYANEPVYWNTTVWYILNGYPTIDFTASDVTDDLSLNADRNIYTVSDMVSAFKNDSDSKTYYLLTNDIDLSSVADFKPLGIDDDNKTHAFNGIFEAAYNKEENRYYTIKNLTITSKYENTGLFAELGSTAQIINLRLENVKITSGNNVGAFAGINNGIIDNCEVVYAENDGLGGSNDYITNLGGIVGQNNGTISNSKSAVSINAKTYSNMSNIGGITGNNDGALYNTISNSKITVDGTHSIYVGGIAGTTSSVISYCLYNNEIIADMNGENIIGGIVGYAFNGARLISCNVTTAATIEGFKVGGIVGYSQKSQVKECLVEATMKAHKAGGVAFTAPEIIIQDVNVQCFINGRDNGSVKAGIAVELHDNSASYCGPIFMAVTFDDVGSNYVTSYHVTNTAWPWEWNPNGIKVDKAIFDKTTMKNAKRWILGDMIGFNQLPINQDGGCSVDVCYGYNGTSVFTNKGFNTLVWKFELDSYPQLINVKTL